MKRNTILPLSREAFRPLLKIMTHLFYLILYVTEEVIRSILTLDLIRFLSIPLKLFYVCVSLAADGYMKYKNLCETMDRVRFSLPTIATPLMATATVDHRTRAQKCLIIITGGENDDEGDNHHQADYSIVVKPRLRAFCWGAPVSYTPPGGDI